MQVHGICVRHPPACCHELIVTLQHNLLMFYDDTNSVLGHALYQEQVFTNIGDAPHVFQEPGHHLPSTSISTLTRPDPQASIIPLSAHDILTRAKRQFYIAMYCLFTVMWCNAPESHAHLSTSFMLFTLTAENLNLWYHPLTMSPCYLSSLIFSSQLSVSNNSFSDGQPSHSENSCSFLCCFWLTSSTHSVYLMLF